MALKKVWMSPDTGNYLLHVLGGSLGIVLLAMLLVVAGTVLSFSMHWSREVSALVLCCGVTALTAVLALGLRRKAVKEVTLFFLTEDDRLFGLDTRRLSHYGHSVLGYVAGTIETQKLLDRLVQMPHVPAGADEILKVEHVKENRSHYAVSCWVRHPNRNVIRRPYFIVRGCPEEDLLLRELERRQTWESALEPAENRNPRFILVSVLTLVGFGGLCILSHPAVARLPRSLYFPCLAGVWISCFFVAYLIVRQSRGQ